MSDGSDDGSSDFVKCGAGPCPSCIQDYGDAPVNHSFCIMRKGHEEATGGPHMCELHGHPFRLDGGPV